uniref:Venom carboxylesterase-6 n=1 Tax=Cacopsylla melanoneura TaxID=428564 RepID=A0A8D8PS43_9HEMI
MNLFKETVVVSLCLCLALCLSSPTLSRVKRIVGGHPADPPPAANLNNAAQTGGGWGQIEDKPVVFVDDDVQQARIYGAVEKRDTQGKQQDEGGEKMYYSFRGIPYAEPPLSVNRFQRPIRKYLEGDVEASKNGNPCVQPSPDGKGVEGDEDCLTLNVYTPKIPSANGAQGELLPVIFWIHGGGYRRGSGLQYDPSDLVMKNTVVVTVQYRLGSLGFLSSEQKDLPGNVGLFDISSALYWTHHYIEGFGGNKSRITVAGQGSGASAAMMLSLNNLTSEWVHGIVAMSGSAISPFAVDSHPSQTYSNITKKSTLCSDKTGVEMVKCMQELGAEDIVKSDSECEEANINNGGFIAGLGEVLTPGPVVEGGNDQWSLPNALEYPVMELITSPSRVGNIPMMTGVTKEETGTGVKGGFKLDILSNLQQSANFINEIMPNKLLSVNSGLLPNQQIAETLKSLFLNPEYLSGLSKSIEGIQEDVNKIVQLTTDALFNLPMFLTSKVWSTTDKTFMYNFDFKPKKSTASHFLAGLPLIRGSEKLESAEISHGEDLIYLFDAKSLDGNSKVHKISEPDDLAMRDRFTSLVAEFARTGTPQLPNSNIKWAPFSAQNSEFLVLSKQPRMETDFRKCQMALWEAFSEVLNSQKCQLLNLQKLLGSQKGLLGGLTGFNNAGKRVQDIQRIRGSLTGGLTGGNINKVIDPLGLGGTAGNNNARPPINQIVDPLGLARPRPTQQNNVQPQQQPSLLGGNRGQNQKPSLVRPLGGLGGNSRPQGGLLG